MSPLPTTIVTDRLTLGPLTEADADEMVHVLGDERMYEFTGGRPMTLDELRARYRVLAGGCSADGAEWWLNWVVRTSADGTAVGAMQATVSASGSSADVAWEVGPAWQGRGIASEAAAAVVDWLVGQGVPLVRAFIRPDHAASAAVAARAGLRRTAELVDGEVVWLLSVP